MLSLDSIQPIIIIIIIAVYTCCTAERYPFGSGRRDRNLGANDDGSATASFVMPFYNRAERVIRVSIITVVYHNPY